MENLAILVPYILMAANIGMLVGILGYAGFCAVSKGCTTGAPAA